MRKKKFFRTKGIFAVAGLIIFVLFIPFADAAKVRIVVIIGNDSSPYKEALNGFQQYLVKQGMEAEFDIYILNSDTAVLEEALYEGKKGGTSLVFTLGAFVTGEALKHIKDIPVIAGMVLRADRLRNSDNSTGVFLEFPVEPQFKMLRRFLPEVRTVGVIYNPRENSELVEAAAVVARDMGLKIAAIEVKAPHELPAALEKMAKSADVLWGVTDNLVLTSQTARHVLLFSYRNRIPFIGLSSAWAKSGALYSLDRDYTDIGMQCGEMALKILQGFRVKAIPPVSPRKVIYSLNLKTARHMKIAIPEALVNGAFQVF